MDLVPNVLFLVSLTSVIIPRLKVQYCAEVITSFTEDRFYKDGQFRVRILLEGLSDKHAESWKDAVWTGYELRHE